MTQLVPHGTLDFGEVAALGLKPEDLHIFSSNINPHGPPSSVVAAVRAAATREVIARYPDRLSLELRALLAAHYGVAPESVLVGNGTADILWLIGLLFARRRRVAIFTPTFGEYANVAALMEAEIAEVCHPGWRALEQGRYLPAQTTLADSIAQLARLTPDLVFICNPNNPTGHYLTPQEMASLRAGAPDALWVVDEAYAEFAAEPWSAVQWIDDGKGLILRSMTKDFALGGLRLGYALAAPALIEQLQTAQPPWNVNGLAQTAGLAAMQELAWRTQTLTQLRRDCATMRAALVERGFAPHPTTVNYFLLPVADPAGLRSALLQERLMVRDCTSFGLPDYIRIAVQTPPLNEQLVAALTRLASRKNASMS